jgi:hypothetical protein
MDVTVVTFDVPEQLRRPCADLAECRPGSGTAANPTPVSQLIPGHIRYQAHRAGAHWCGPPIDHLSGLSQVREPLDGSVRS